jgi:alkylated DNA nucleotide flippase Atl1
MGCPGFSLSMQLSSSKGRALLEAEGVAFDADAALDLEKYRWWPDD